jgi:hypothetical protein
MRRHADRFGRRSRPNLAQRLLLACSAVLLSARLGAADGRPPSLLVAASCEALAGPGKVHCAVRVRPEAAAWRWGDVIVVAAPPFAPPLRTRSGVYDVVRNDETGVEFALALAATADGIGPLRVRARAVLCGEFGCRPVAAEAEARVVVGASP